ncbi:toxin-antitoxin system antitoxin [Atlantibacter subterranea]|uniref:Toxin-antitoxin system antitoxin n=1 Tax=Atlantibacter subterraneus TaxID=255519 RepID=A0A3R9LHI7_9ENTR|nr:YdaS family helix-turn-helix protein [Atlantibacter subterranea]RSB59008.1 toxin-antitoxin system antitoxin [Atlantibacter subterranea]RSE01177.1 toxin-antitoxin system antitoxin [Atlantibacter subterranea]RSE22137.1 toxin-antitoxin system antitoxin [Atlantibacter subterranea]
MNPVIQKAIKIAGSQKELGSRVGVSQKTVHAWLHGADFAGKYILPIVTATEGKISAYEILNSLNKQDTK